MLQHTHVLYACLKMLIFGTTLKFIRNFHFPVRMLSLMQKFVFVVLSVALGSQSNTKIYGSVPCLTRKGGPDVTETLLKWLI